jgi:guanylate kinase
MAYEYLHDIGQAVRGGYQPNPDTRELMLGVDIVTVSGPAGVGKTTIMNDSHLKVVHGWTTQPGPRATDDSYRSVETVEERQRLLEDVRRGELVAAMIHPITGEFFGVRREAVSVSRTNILETFPEQARQLIAQALFGTVRPAYITVPSYDAWQARLSKQGAVGAKDYDRRMREAKSSLLTACDDDDFYFILNDSPMAATDSLRLFALEGKRKPHGNLNARRAGQLMLRGLTQTPTARLVTRA